MSIGAKIKEQRAKLGISQQKLANAIGVSVDTIRSLEIDRANPSVETLNKLADLFEVSADYLLGREEKKVMSFATVVDSFTKIVNIINKYDPQFATELMDALGRVPLDDEELKPEDIDENLILFMSMLAKGMDNIKPKITEDLESKRKLIEKIRSELEETKKTPDE